MSNISILGRICQKASQFGEVGSIPLDWQDLAECGKCNATKEPLSKSLNLCNEATRRKAYCSSTWHHQGEICVTECDEALISVYFGENGSADWKSLYQCDTEL